MNFGGHVFREDMLTLLDFEDLAFGFGSFEIEKCV